MPGSFTFTFARQSGLVLIPATSFAITGNYLRFTLTGQAAMAAADYITIYATIEGNRLRELISDVHSIGLLVRSSVGPLKFGVALRNIGDGGSAPQQTWRSLCKLATISTANVWTVIQLPNLPFFDSSTTWNTAPGTYGYEILITPDCGTTYTAPANDSWQQGNFYGAVGQDHFAAIAPVNSTFDLAFVQHEPGPLCTQFIDLPFGPNLRSCQRYLAKSWGYSSATPAADGNWRHLGTLVPSSTTVRSFAPFPVEMAKVPTVTVYDNAGNGNSIYVDYIGQSPVSTINVLKTGIQNIILASASAQTTPVTVLGNWLADTGW
jgi:hypothetical protein